MLQTSDDIVPGERGMNTPTDAPPSGSNGQQPAAQRIDVSDAGIQAGYANFCWVTSNAEEVLLDFGLSAQRLGQRNTSVQITHRLALTNSTAKRLLAALKMALERQEQAVTKPDHGGAPRGS
jgi:hypothetical protein